MTELMLLFAVFTGGSIGWLVRNWYSRRELVSLRRQQQLERTGLASYSSSSYSGGSEDELLIQLRGSEDARLDAEGRANLLEGRLSAVETENSDLTQSFSFKDDEIDELFQIASRVKPLEFELAKSRAEVQRLNTMSKGEGHLLDLSEQTIPSSRSVVSHSNASELQNTVDQIAPLELELAQARRELNGLDESSAVDFQTKLNSNYEEELDELYRAASQVKPLEFELRRKDAEIEKLKKYKVSDHALHQGSSKDQAEALRIEIEDLQTTNRNILQEKEELKKNLETLEDQLREKEGQQSGITQQTDQQIGSLQDEIQQSRLVAKELENVERLLSEQEQLVETSQSLETVLQSREQQLVELHGQVADLESRNDQLSETHNRALENLSDQLQDTQDRLDGVNRSKVDVEKLALKHRDQELLISTQQRQVENEIAKRESLQEELADALRLLDERFEAIQQLEAVVNAKNIELNDAQGKQSDSQKASLGLQSELAQLTSDRVELHNSYLVLEGKFGEAEKKCGLQQQELQLAARKVAQFHAQLNDSQQQQSTLKMVADKVPALDSQLAERDLEIGRIKNRLVETDHLKLTITERDRQLAGLRTKVDTYEIQLKTSENLQHELRKLKGVMIAKEAELAESQQQAQKMVQLETAVNAKTRELNDLRAQLARSSEFEQKYRVEQQANVHLQKQSSMVPQLKALAEEKDEQISVLQLQAAKLSELQQSLQKSLSDNTALQTDLAAMSQLKLRVVERENEITQLQASQKELINLAPQLQRQIDKAAILEEDVHSRDEKLSAALSEIDRLTESVIKLEPLSDKLSKHEADLSDKEQKILRLTHESTESRSRSDELQKALNNKQKEADALAKVASRVNDLENTLKKNNAELEEMEKELSTNSGLVEKLKSDVAKSSIQLNAQNSEITALKITNGKHSELEQIISSLQQKVDQQSELEQKYVQLKGSMASTQELLQESAAREGDLQFSLSAQKEDAQKLQLQLSELSRLEATVIARDQQIEHLKKRLLEIEQREATSVPAITRTTTAIPLYQASKNKDDLKKIYGIGPVMERMLNELGITSFEQIKDFKKTDIDKVTNAIEAFPGRIERDDWIGGAEKQFEKKYGSETTL